MGVEGLKLFDAHFHIIDYRFPIKPNQGYLPPPFSCKDYLKAMKEYHLTGGAVVSGSFQGFDTKYLLSALKELGDGFVGVAQLPANIADERIIHLHKSGIRAVRFNLRRGGSDTREHIEVFANRLHNLVGWHVELYAEARDLEELYPTLVKLPMCCIDHLGLSKAGFHQVLRLIENGKAYVKATGFGRLNFDVASAISQVVKVNPNALIFGTDLPSTRAPRPYSHQDLRLILEALNDPGLIDKVLYKNALELYRP